MYLLNLTDETRAKFRCLSRQAVGVTNWVMVDRGAGVVMAIVSRCIETPYVDHVTNPHRYQFIQAAIIPEKPNTIVEEPYGTLCCFNWKVPGEWQGCYWLKDGPLVVCQDASRMADELREAFNRKFFEKVEQA